METSTIIILVAFAVYLAMMIIIGAFYSKKSSNTEDYFLGGRNLGGFVAALSAQASDMSGWLLMGLPGAIFLFGMNGGDGWCALGLLIGTILNWIFIASRLRKYTIKANNSVTLPRFFENRFRDEKKVLLLVSSIIIVLFFTVYCASALAAGGQLFEAIFGIEYQYALIIGAIVILIYTLLGGFMAVCTTDFIQGTMMIIALIAVPVIAIASMKNGIAQGLADSDVALKSMIKANPDFSAAEATAPGFINMFSGVNVTGIISGLAWGLGYFGMPHILVRFMAVKNEKEMRKSKVVAISWVTISLAMACVIGIVGRAYMSFADVVDAGKEKVFILMIQRVFSGAPFIAGIFLCGILAAIMSTADSQLLVSASAIAEDIVKGCFKPDADDKFIMRFSRTTIFIVALIAFVIAWNPNSSVMGLVSDAWAGLGAAFGPLVLMSLFWKRTNLPGGVAGLISGALTVIVWDYIPIGEGLTIGGVTGIYSLAVGFPVSLIFIVIFSLMTKAPSQEIVSEFEAVKAEMKSKE